MKKDLLSINDLTKTDIENIFRLTDKLKNKHTTDLKNKVLAMIFEKSSTRTRVSFEVAMQQLGGHAIFLSKNDIQLGRGEPIADTARVLSRYVDGIMARLFKYEDLLELAKHSSVPVINGLTEFEHPCQILADLYTVLKKKGTLNIKFAWVGDANNVCNSLILASKKLGFDLTIATPKGYEPKEEVLKGSKVKVTNNQIEAVKNSDVIETDTWISMGQEEEKEKRLRDFQGFQVNKELVKHAKSSYLFLHCMPAYRGYEVSSDIIDGKNSVVFEEAEARLHTQKAVLYLLIK